MSKEGCISRRRALGPKAGKKILRSKQKLAPSKETAGNPKVAFFFLFVNTEVGVVCNLVQFLPAERSLRINIVPNIHVDLT